MLRSISNITRFAFFRLVSKGVLIVCTLLPLQVLMAQDLTWQSRSPVAKPSGRGYPAMAYDSARQNIVLFGGQSIPFFPSDLNDTWIWDGNNWVQKFPATSPPARLLTAMAYDQARGQTVLFGGWQFPTSTIFSDTWIWDGNNWTEKKPATSPPTRYDASMVYDAMHKVIVLFGGGSPSGPFLNDTWIWDGYNWTQKFPATVPSPRRGYSLAFDPVHQQIVLFGGYDSPSGTLTNDTWTWDGDNWTKRSPSNSPSSRVYSALVWDGNTGRVLLFGGLGSGIAYNDTWQWDGNNWIQSSPIVSPSGTFGAGLAYDVKHSAVVLFGGNCCGTGDETWAWGKITQSINLSAEIPTVTQAPPISTFPAPVNLLTGTKAFVAANQSQLSPGMRSYIQAEILRLESTGGTILFAPLDPFTKDFINAAADNLQGWGKVASISQAFLDVGNLLSSYSQLEAAFYLSGIVKDVVGALPYAPPDSQELKLAKRTSDLISLLWNAKVAGTDPVTNLVVANIMIWTDYFPDAAHNFAKDPLALDYQTPVPVVLPNLPNIVGTQNDAFLSQWNSATLRSIAFLEAVNASFDRYAAARQAGDNLSATVQLAAYLHYLRLFTEALADANHSFAQLPSILHQAGLVGGTGNVGTLQLLQAPLVANGLPSDFTAFLLRNGVTSAQLPSYLSAMTSLTFKPGPDIYTVVAGISRSFTALSARKVQIDIKPGDTTNPINLSSNGLVPVAILSDATFDATRVDPASIIVSGGLVRLLAKGAKYSCSAKDVNGDRRLDLVCHIPTTDLNLQAGDTTALLTAMTFGGQTIAGIDSIKTK